MHSIPGKIALALAAFTTTAWIYWGAAEMYFEGWGLPFPEPLRYFAPGAASLALTLASCRWPRFGGLILAAAGGAFTAWWLGLQAARGGLTVRSILGLLPFSGALVITGVLFIIEGVRLRRARAEGWFPSGRWLARNLRYVLALGFPVAAVLVASIQFVPMLATRVDDGNRGARLIEGNGVALVWAPKGPGWNWKQSWGGHPSWNGIALYGAEPAGFGKKRDYGDRLAGPDEMRRFCLCRYLSEDGTILEAEPRDIWRMPTADEIARSLIRHGESAGASWDGASQQADFEETPDKETPLWAPDEPPIYYWAADEYDDGAAYYVSYNGWIRHQPKTWGNPRHGYRCVREPGKNTAVPIIPAAPAEPVAESSLEVRVFRILNGDAANPVLDAIMPPVTDFRRSRVLLILVWCALVVFGKSKGRWAALMLIPVVAASDQISSHLIKPLVHRMRPCEVLGGVHLWHGPEGWIVTPAELLRSYKASFSFPSSHAANITASMIFLGLAYRKVLVPLAAIAALVSYSRVYIGVHWTSDILAGIALGLLLAWPAHLLFKYLDSGRMKKKLDAPRGISSKE